MIGVFNYTMILTYLSALSAGMGILVTLSGNGRPCAGCAFLLFCGLCDGFDGMVARTKKNRTEYEKRFGIQLDSLCDVIAFVVLPLAIGGALLRLNPKLNEILNGSASVFAEGGKMLFFCGVMLLYLLMGTVRLAHFNVSEEERQSAESGKRRFFQGVPVTSVSLIFSTVLLLQQLTGMDMTMIFFVLMLLTAVGFVVNIRIPKPNKAALLIMTLIGGTEFILLLLQLFSPAA